MRAREDQVIPIPFWIEPRLHGPLFRCTLGTGHVIWLRAESAALALKAALSELDALIPDLNRVTIAISRHLEVPKEK